MVGDKLSDTQLLEMYNAVTGKDFTFEEYKHRYYSLWETNKIFGVGGEFNLKSGKITKIYTVIESLHSSFNLTK